MTFPKPKKPAVLEGPCFETRADALDYVITRILAAESLDGAGDPYSSTFTRSYETVSGEKADYFLVADAARELQLAEGFDAYGFGREALAHYENLLAFHAASPQGAVARNRIEAVRKKTVLGLVPPMSVVFRDSQGRIFVPAGTEAAEKPSLARIEKPYLERFAALKGPFLAVGFIDDAGTIVRSLEAPPDATEPAVFIPKGESPDPESEGAVSSGRDYYALYRCESLFAAERVAKSQLFAEFLGLAGPSTLSDPAERRLAADALVYLGRCDDARKLRAALGVPIPPNPLETQADLFAADPRSTLHLDALWRLRIRDNPRFVLRTASAVTTDMDLPLEIDACALSEMTFSFAKIEGPLPATEAELKAWLPKAAGTPSHEETFAIAPGKSTLRLPVRAAGAWRVTAKAQGLSCSFIAVRTDLSLEVFALPGETFLTASRPGITIAASQKSLGTTGEDGALVPSAPMRARICDEHKGCCASCQSCDHHHTDDRSLSANPSVFVTGGGQFFRATAKLDVTEAVKFPVAPPAPILFVHTDRPAYKAGDTLRFRGILRLPKAPLLRSDVARLRPGAEREVAVAIRCAEDAIFTRTYVTGEHGTFQGEFTLPLSAYRAEYALAVTYEGAQVSRPFKVIDYRKSDYAIVLTPEKGGVRVQAGYVWDAPVSGATVTCTVGGQPAAVRDNFISVPEAAKVRVQLLRGAEELAEKELDYHAPLAEGAPTIAEAAEAPVASVPEAPAKTESATAETPRAIAFAVRTDKPLYRRGETIEIEVEGPWDEAEATVVVGDVQVYDLVRVPIRNGRGTAHVAARPIHDPGVTVFALCNGAQVRADISVRVNQMKLSIEAPPSGRPGEQVDVTLKGDPGAAVALAAVDEAIYMVREDDTPEIYSFFHPARPAALAYAKFGSFEYDGESHKVEKLPGGDPFRRGKRVGRRLFRNSEVYDTMGVGMGGGGGGSYGGRLGGRESLTARGGGTRASESAVLSCLRGIGSLQQPNGAWPGAFASEAGVISEVGATSLALLSLLGAGYSQLSKDEYPDTVNPAKTIRMGEIVKKALRWLLENQAPDGRIGASADRILNHALAALALSEAYGMTASQPLKDPAQTAMDWLTAQQSTNGGWHRADRTRNGEILASVFAVMALKSAQLSELPTNPSVSALALQYFTETIGEDGLPAGTPTRAQVGGSALARIFLRKARGDSRLTGAATWLVSRPPSWNQADFLGWYLSSLALFQDDGPDGPHWRAWNDPLKAALVPQQAKSGLWTVGNESVFHTAIGSLSLEVYYRYSNVFGGVGGKGAGPVEQARYLAPLVPEARVRVYFPDTVHWAPEVVTNEQGEARVSFRLPEQITTTRLTARGIAKSGAAGHAVSRIQTHQPFFVKIVAPEFAVLGDEIDVRVDVYNYANAELEAAVRLEGAVGERKTIVHADRPATVSWRVRADNLAGLRLVAHAVSGDLRDSMERTVPVQRVGREMPVTSRGKSETGGSFPFEGQKGVQELVLKIHPRTGNLTQVLDALRYLNQYPYGCTEQTLAKFVPNVLTADMLKKLAIPTEKFNASFEGMMKAGLERLTALQHSNGAWGWYDNDHDDPFMTSSAVHGLSECDRLGFKVDAVVLKRGREALLAIAKEEKDQNRLAYEAYVLGEEFDRLLEQRSQLSSYAQALLALALHRAGRPEASVLAKDLAASVQGDHWVTPSWYYKWDDVSIETTAYAMQALTAVDPRSPLIAKGREWLLAQRTGNRWRSTKDTAVAIATLIQINDLETLAGAVGAVPKEVRKETLFKKIGVTLNGGEPHEILIDVLNPTNSRFEAHFDRVQVGTNVLHFQKLDLHSDFQFDLEATQRLFDDRAVAETRGMDVKVSYDRPLEDLRLGDEVVARVTVAASQEVDYVMVQAPIPAGCEVVRGSGVGPFARFEDRYEKAIFFLRSVKDQPVQLTFRMRSAFAGRFTVLPAWAGSMYNEEIYGATAPSAARIVP